MRGALANHVRPRRVMVVQVTGRSKPELGSWGRIGNVGTYLASFFLSYPGYWLGTARRSLCPTPWRAWLRSVYLGRVSIVQCDQLGLWVGDNWSSFE